MRRKIANMRKTVVEVWTWRKGFSEKQSEEIGNFDRAMIVGGSKH